MRDCGGCRGEGAHWRWCSNNIGINAAVRGKWGTRAEQLADEIGSNYPDIANMLYGIAGKMYTEAGVAREQFESSRDSCDTD